MDRRPNRRSYFCASPKVTTTFSLSRCTPISYGSFLRPTAVSRLNLETAVGSQQSPHPLCTHRKTEKYPITTKVAPTFFLSRCTPISHTSFLRPTAVSTFKLMRLFPETKKEEFQGDRRDGRESGKIFDDFSMPGPASFEFRSTSPLFSSFLNFESLARLLFVVPGCSGFSG